MKYKINPFFKGFSFAIVFSILTIGLVNYLVDPLRYRPNRVKQFNHFLAPEVDALIPIDNIFHVYSKGPTVKYSIIGTSHIVNGVSICNYPDMEKIARSSMQIEESSRILKRILENALVEKTVFVEIGSQRKQQLEDNNYLDPILSFRTFVFSLRTLRVNFFSNNNPSISRSCLANDTISVGLNSIDELNKKKYPIRLITNRELEAIKEIVNAKYNVKKKMKHRVLFFLSPLPYETIQQAKYINISHKTDSILNELINKEKPTYDDVKFSFVNLNDFKIGREFQFKKDNFYKGWNDADHFKLNVGDQVLKYLLEFTK